jgi:hypothetical protein
MGAATPSSDQIERMHGRLPELTADYAGEHALRSMANAQFTRAIILFEDGSQLLLEHSSRQNRWAKASASGTAADNVCLSLYQFRLNAKHLELFFNDGSRIEFHPSFWNEAKDTQPGAD